VISPVIVACAIAILGLPIFASGARAQSADLATQVYDLDAVVVPNSPSVPANASHVIRRDPVIGRGIIIVSGRGRKTSRRITRPQPGDPAMLNPQPLPPKDLPAH
jgi:hypothetical protein